MILSLPPCSILRGVMSLLARLPSPILEGGLAHLSLLSQNIQPLLFGWHIGDLTLEERIALLLDQPATAPGVGPLVPPSGGDLVGPKLNGPAGVGQEVLLPSMRKVLGRLEFALDPLRLAVKHLNVMCESRHQSILL